MKTKAKKYFIYSSLFYVFIFVLDFLVSVITSNFADEFVKLNTVEFQNTIKTMLIIILVFGVKFLLEKLIPYKLELIKHQLKFQFKNNILKDIYNLRKELLFELSGEQVLQIVDKDSEIVASFRYEYLVEFFSSLFIFAMVLVSFLVLSYKVTFIFVLLAILQVIPPIITKNSLYKIYMDTRKIEQDTTNWIISASEGRDVLKTFNATDWYFKNKRNLDELNVNAGTKAEIAFALENAMYSMLDLILKIVSYAIIGMAIYNQEITIADSVFMIMLLSTFYSNFENITKYISKVQEFNVSKTRINNILNKDINSNDVTISDTDSLIDLKIEDLDFCQNLNGTNLKLEKGDKILISGSNGKGKTTIFNLILGLLHSNSKLVIRDVPERLISYLNQNDLCISFTMREIMGMLEGKEYVKKVQELCNYFGIKELEWSKYLDELSGGEREKFALAVCLASDKNILLLDEPTNHLDDKSVEKLIGVLRSDSREMIVISHDKRLNKICNKTLDLDSGDNYV